MKIDHNPRSQVFQQIKAKGSQAQFHSITSLLNHPINMHEDASLALWALFRQSCFLKVGKSKTRFPTWNLYMKKNKHETLKKKGFFFRI